MRAHAQERNARGLAPPGPNASARQGTHFDSNEGARRMAPSALRAIERNDAVGRVAPPDPSAGARRRELVLLAAYVVLAVIGVWAVVVSELATQDPAFRDAGTGASSTQKSR